LVEKFPVMLTGNLTLQTQRTLFSKTCARSWTAARTSRFHILTVISYISASLSLSLPLHLSQQSVHDSRLCWWSSRYLVPIKVSVHSQCYLVTPGFFGREGSPLVATGDVGVRRDTDVVVGVKDLGSRDVDDDVRADVGVVNVRVWATWVWYVTVVVVRPPADRVST